MVDVEFERRKQEILDECKIAPQVLDGLLPRLEKFMDPRWYPLCSTTYHILWSRSLCPPTS